MNNNDNLPPQAIDLEEAVLGAVMLERDAFDEVSGIIVADNFYKKSVSDTNRYIVQMDRMKVSNTLDLGSYPSMPAKI